MSKKFLAIALVFVLTYIMVSYGINDTVYAQPRSMTLTVTTLEGEAIPEATVYFKESVFTTNGSGITSAATITETDVINVLIFAEGYNAASETITYEDLDETDNITVRLNVGEASAIRSLITDAEGQPIQGANLMTQNGGDSLTDTYGYGHIVGVHEGNYTVIASKAGYNTYCRLIPVTDANAAIQPITLTGDGETATQYIIKGKVTSDLEPNGVSGITITVGETSVISDRYGYYAIGSFTKGDEVTLTAEDPDHRKYTRTVAIDKADVIEDIALNAYLPVKVTVKDSKTENPINNATVYLNETEDTTDITGKSEVGKVWNGPIFNLVAYAEGYNPKTAVVTFDIAKPTGEITIELDEGNLGAVISTVTSAADSNELPESSLTTLNGGSSTADSSGLCVITGLPEGKYTVIASKEGYNPKYDLIDLTENRVAKVPFELETEPDTGAKKIITGQVISTRTKNDINGVKISDGTITSETDLNGYYAIGYYDSGTAVNLTTEFEGFYESAKQASPAGETTTVNFELERDTKIAYDAYIFGYEDGTFRPNNKITRAEAANLLYSLYGNNKKPANELVFTDVPANQYFTDAIKFVQESGYMTGYGDGTFKPYNHLNRQELAVIIDRIKKYTDTVNNPFSDVEDGHWAEESINRLYANGVAMGYTNNTFKPRASASRAEMVTFIARAENRQEAWLGSKTFNDVAATHFGYNYIMNAANGHTRW